MFIRVWCRLFASMEIYLIEIVPFRITGLYNRQKNVKMERWCNYKSCLRRYVFNTIILKRDCFLVNFNSGAGDVIFVLKNLRVFFFFFFFVLPK